MADQSAAVAGYGELVWNPGNPALPTLPAIGDPSLGKLSEFGLGADTPFITARSIVPTPPIGQSAVKSVGFADWYLDTIWITPQPVDFGDISDQKDINVTVYSTHTVQRTLNDVAFPVSGLDLVTDTSPGLPITIESFSDEVLVFRASQAGPSTFDDDSVITFDNTIMEVRVVGRRVLLLFSEPQDGAIEQLQFKTDLMRAKNGYEQAFAVRKAPRSRIRYVFRISSADDEKRTRLLAILLGGNPLLPVGIQLWWEARKVTTAALSSDLTVNVPTTNMSINNGDNMVFTTPANANIIVQVESFTASDITFTQAVGETIPLDSYCMPVRFGRLTNTQSVRTAQINLEDLQVSVITQDEVRNNAINPTYFDLHPFESPGRVILKERCFTGGTLSSRITHERTTLDSETGRIYTTASEPLGDVQMQAFVWIRSVEQLFAWRQFLHELRGSWGTFYIPSFQNDLPLNADFVLGGNEFDIPNMGIAQFFNGVAPRRDLRIVLDDGTVHYRRITGVVDNVTFETVTVDSVVGSVGVSAIASTTISWMSLVRISGDVASFRHTLLGEAELSFGVRTVKEA